jgi:hypothetical protein
MSHPGSIRGYKSTSIDASAAASRPAVESGGPAEKLDKGPYYGPLTATRRPELATEEVTHRVTIETYTSRSTGAGPALGPAGTKPPKKDNSERWKKRLLLGCQIGAGIGGIAAVITLLLVFL